MKIIHIFGANASGKSTLLKELQGTLEKSNIAILREHSVTELTNKFEDQLTIYRKNQGKKTKSGDTQDKLRHDHMVTMLGASVTLNKILQYNALGKEALIIQGNCLPVVEGLMNSVNTDVKFDPAEFPMIDSIYLKADPIQVTNRNIRRLDDYYKLSASQLDRLKQTNVVYQQAQIYKYQELARKHKSIIVHSGSSIDQSATLLKQAILKLVGIETD